MSNYIFWVSVPVHDLNSVGLCLDWISLVPVKQPTRILVNTSHKKKCPRFAENTAWLSILNLKSCGCEHYIGPPTSCKIISSFMRFWMVILIARNNWTISMLLPLCATLNENRQSLWCQLCRHLWHRAIIMWLMIFSIPKVLSIKTESCHYANFVVTSTEGLVMTTPCRCHQG